MNLYDPIINLLFPARCACCGRLTQDRELICHDCHAALPYIPITACRKCGQARSECECKRLNFLFSGMTAPFYNEGVARRGIYDIKYKGRRDNAEFFGICMAERFAELFTDVSVDVVAAVPTSSKKKSENGYDHAAVLAKAVAKRLGCRYDGRILKRVGNAKPQHSLNYAERMASVKNLFRADKKLAAGKTVLLVDDIRTTAATLNACTKQLMLSGAENVYAATALITKRSKEKQK